MKTATTRAVEAKRLRYMTLQKASTLQIVKSLWRRLDVYVYALIIGFIIGLSI